MPRSRGIRTRAKITPPPRWTDEERALLIPYVEDMNCETVVGIARRLGRSLSACHKQIGILRQERGIQAPARNGALTQDEIQTIFANHVRGRSDWTAVQRLLPHRNIEFLRDAYVRIFNKIHNEVQPPKFEPCVQPCLRCRRDFDSWDRRRNRLCIRCIESEETAYNKRLDREQARAG